MQWIWIATQRKSWWQNVQHKTRVQLNGVGLNGFHHTQIAILWSRSTEGGRERFNQVVTRPLTRRDKIKYSWPVWPDWAIFWTLGNFYRHLAIFSGHSVHDPHNYSHRISFYSSSMSSSSWLTTFPVLATTYLDTRLSDMRLPDRLTDFKSRIVRTTNQCEINCECKVQPLQSHLLYSTTLKLYFTH